MDNWPETRESLILKVKDPQNAAAWADFMEIYRPVVYRMARGRGLQHADAEDLSQQVFLMVSQAIERWVPEPSLPPFRVWLGRIARNAIVNAVTRRRPDVGAGSTTVQQAMQELPDREATCELVRETRRQAIRWSAEQIRAEFSEATWAMFEQSFLQGIEVEAVAAALGKSTGAVYMARYRVVQRLRVKANEVSEVWSESR